MRVGRASNESRWILRAVFPAILLGLASAGCATRSTALDLQREIERLRQENFQLRKDLTEARVRLEMTREAGTGGAPAASNPAATGSSPAKLVEIPDVPAPSGPPPVVYSEPVTDRTYVAGAPTQARSQGGAVAVAPGPGSSEASRLMAEARAMMDSGDSAAALAIFERMVSTYATDAMADDAQVGIGEAYFRMRRYEEAIGAYRKVADLFPYGDQVPFAFLKMGFAHLALNQRDLALDDFKTVSQAYPGTEAATVARQQIAHLAASSR